MSNRNSAVPSKQSMGVLSHLLLSRESCLEPASSAGLPPLPSGRMSRQEFDELAALASSNHVLVRGMERLIAQMREAGDGERASWAAHAQEAELGRIRNAVAFLHRICELLKEEGHDVTVIKSLDHWPDLGSDLDLYTNADSDKVIDAMQLHFQAELAPRSWGDRLAHKWNFLIPGLPEAVEIHMGRLGQTGEQVALASAVTSRSREIRIDGHTFRVPSVSERLMISTLQRMYRHFYFRLCDIVDSADLAERGAVDYEDLRRAARKAGIWEGVATYLLIVSDYVRQYRGTGLDLPRFVRAAARFGGKEVFYRREFLRVPILPQSASLYGSQLGGLLRRGELRSSARLGLLPWLATAAAVGEKITGSDKGIW